jgi:hypothetical protein
MSFPVIAWPGFFEYAGISLARQSRGKSFYLLWIPACAGMTDKAGSCFIGGFWFQLRIEDFLILP